MELNVKQENTIRDFLREQTDDNILDIVREINGWDGQLEDLTWYNMDEFDELLSGIEPWEIARAAFFGEFNPTHDYWHYNTCGNFESTDYLDYDNTDIESIINALWDVPFEDFPNELKDLLDEMEDENKDEK